MIPQAPLVSVVIPIYRVEKYLDQCVQSVVEQRYRNLEIILVDDGSPDSCPRMCDDWAMKDSRVKVIHKANGGLSDARNAGIRQARGDYICCVDSDDAIDRTLVERSIGAVREFNADVVVFKYAYMSENGEVADTHSNGSHNSDQVFPAQGVLEQMLDEKIPSYAWSFFVSKNIYADFSIKYPLGRLMEDLATTYKIICAARRIVIIDDPLYFYRLRDGSILNKKTPQLATDYVTAIDEISQFVYNNYPSLLVKQSNWTLKNFCTALIWSYDVKNLFPSGEYISMKKRVLRLMDVYIKRISFFKLSNIVIIEIVLSRLGFISLISRISKIRHLQ